MAGEQPENASSDCKNTVVQHSKTRRYFKNKELEIQKFHGIFSGSHTLHSQTRLTDTTYDFFPSSATAPLCDYFHFLMQLDFKEISAVADSYSKTAPTALHRNFNQVFLSSTSLSSCRHRPRSLLTVLNFQLTK